MTRTRSAILLTASNGLASLCAIVLAAYLSRTFDETTYATFRQVLLPTNLAAPLLILGMPTSILFFLSRDDTDRPQILANNLATLLLVATGWSLFLLLGGYALITRSFDNPQLQSFLPFAVALSFLQLVTASFNNCLFSLGRHRHVVVVNLLRVVLVVGGGATAVYLFRSLHALLAANLIAILTLFPLQLLLMFRGCGGVAKAPTLAGIREQVSFGAVLSLATVLGSIHQQTDKFIVAVLRTPLEYAVFFNGAREIPFVSIVHSSVTAVVLPDLTRMLSEQRYRDAHALWQSATQKVATILFPLTGLLICVAHELIVLVWSAKYAGATPVFVGYLMLLPLRSISYGSACVAAGRKDLVLKGAIIGLVANIALTIPAVRYFGVVGAAYATVISIGAVLIPWYLVQLARVFHVGLRKLIPWRNLGKIALSTVVAASVFHLLRQGSSDLTWLLLLSVMYCGVVLALFFLFRVIDPQWFVKVIGKAHG